jgi:hypothetical protein
MRTLYGKGVWARHEREVPHAIDMAQAIGARIIFFKTGQEGVYFEPAAQRTVLRIQDAGLVPCAWPVITCRDPDAEAEVAIQTILEGYAGLVFDVSESASGRYEGAARLGEQMLETELPPEVMFFTSLPNISAHLDIPYAELSRFCKGGFMPRAFASYGWDAVYTLDVIAYREFRLWSEAHEIELPLYPILGLYRDGDSEEPLTIGEMRSWFRALTRHKPTFFSVYHADAVSEVAWPLLAAIETTPHGQQPPPDPSAEGEYVTVHPGETVTHLCAEHGCTEEQFWAWNGHLWDVQGQPHDPALLERGWIVRVK